MSARPYAWIPRNASELAPPPHVYTLAEIVDDLIDAGWTTRRLARYVGVTQETADAWAARRHRPQSRHRPRLEALHAHLVAWETAA